MTTNNQKLPELVLGFSKDPTTEKLKIEVLAEPLQVADESPLTREEGEIMQSFEEEFRANLQGFYAIATVLLEIKTRRLYREDYPSFEAFCRDQRRWNAFDAPPLGSAQCIVSMEPKPHRNQLEMRLDNENASDKATFLTYSEGKSQT